MHIEETPTYVQPVGRLDKMGAQVLRGWVRTRLASPPPASLCLQLDALTFMDGKGLAALHTLARLARRYKVELTLTKVPPPTASMLQLVRMDALCRMS